MTSQKHAIIATVALTAIAIATMMTTPVLAQIKLDQNNTATIIVKIQGNSGGNGTQGPRGFNGTQGAQGLQGEPGLQGERGLQGIQGERGLPGTNGEIRICIQNSTGQCVSSTPIQNGGNVTVTPAPVTNNTGGNTTVTPTPEPQPPIPIPVPITNGTSGNTTSGNVTEQVRHR